MNRTEELTHAWLIRSGYAESDITFQRRRSPDFLTADGRCWETKLARNNTVTFTRGQVEGLKNQGCSVVVFEAETPSDDPRLVTPYDATPCPGQIGKYRFILAGGATAIPVRIDAELYAALVKVAKKNRRSATAELNELVAHWLEVSEEWALPEEGESK